MSKEVIIVGYSRPTNKGITLHTNINATVHKDGTPMGKETWVSWDKIGKALFQNYTQSESVAELNKLRNDKD